MRLGKRKAHPFAVVRNGTWRTKRRRTTRYVRRGNRGRRGTLSVTSRNFNPHSPFKIRGRRISKRAWRRSLYLSTRHANHYRSIAATSLGMNTAISGGLADTSLQSMMAQPCFSVVNGNEFWKIAGGLQDTNFGISPVWSGVGVNPPGSIIIRGGRIWISVTDPSGSSDPVKIRVQLVFAKQQQRNFGDTAPSNTFNDWLLSAGAINFNNGLRPVGWDITCAPDWEQYFYKPVMDKSFEVRPIEGVTHYWKIKPVKIDTGSFQVGAGWFPWWLVYLNEVTQSDNVAETMRVVIGHNISFAVGDINQ